MEEREDLYPDLGYGESHESYDRAMEKKKFHVPHGDETVGIGRSLFFLSHPTVVHFGGFQTQQEHSQTISIINISSHSQRLSILPPTTDEFKISFSKCGILAPGMSQKITVLFTPNEYKYHYDCIRIHTEGQDLLVPLHGYPVMNKVSFPTQFSFGNTPLCEPVERTLTLRCSIPVNFSYSIDVIQPHPYFLIKPLQGVVPANGFVDIHVTFNPITLGTCTTVVRLFIAEHNFKPVETVITARAVSGIIETQNLTQAEQRISNLLTMKTKEVTQKFGQTSFSQIEEEDSFDPSDSSVPENLNRSDVSPRTVKLRQNDTKKRSRRSGGNDPHSDPVATVLKKTFGANDVEATLNSALLKPTNSGVLLLGSKVPVPLESGPLKGTKKVVGNSAATQPVHPRGVGSGNVFDAGAEYIVQQTTNKMNKTQKSTTSVKESEEKIVEGLRIPAQLNTTAAVNFVLTQEQGKLKPKDLKIAIERNREERRKQEQEQAKIREDGGAGAGGLDLRAVLADERLNSEPNDAFKRQLREMAFLADMEQTKKQEVEKSFRVSEEFVGANLLTPEELQVIHDQRKAYRRHRDRAEWRNYQSRMHTTHFLPQSDEIRGGAPAPTSHSPKEPLDTTPAAILSLYPPSFDSNKNDVWSKRMNTLRKFIYVVGKFVVQRRVQKRLDKIRKRLTEAGVTDRHSARAFVESEALNPAPQTTSTQKVTPSAELASSSINSQSLAAVVCALPNQALERRKNAEAALLDPFVPTPDMCRRVLFPKFIDDEVSLRKPLPAPSIDEPMNFDDRTFFALKIRPDFIDMGYEREALPLCPVYFRPMSKLNMQRMQGAPEEKSIRPPAGSLFTPADLESLFASGSDPIFAPSNFVPPPFQPELKPLPKKDRQVSFDSSLGEEVESKPLEVPLLMENDILKQSIAPSWLMETKDYDPRAVFVEPSAEKDFFSTRPEYRIYPPDVPCKETDPEWLLRPTFDRYEYDVDPTLRTRLLEIPGFLTAQTYLLGSYSSRIEDPLPPPGPTLSDFYLPDCDYHGSGLYCFPTDHKRSLVEFDSDISPLQSKLAKEDYLTDSESDDEDEYRVPKPTLQTVKEILRPPPPSVVEAPPPDAKGKKPAAPAKSASVTIAPSPIIADQDAFSVLDDADRKVDQVELMRDRKILEHATHIRKIQEEKIDLLTDRYDILNEFRSDILMNRLVKLSQASSCPLYALPVQLPLHSYSEELVSILEDEINTSQNDFGGSIFGSPTKAMG